MSEISKIKNNLNGLDFNKLFSSNLNKYAKKTENIKINTLEEIELLSDISLNYNNIMEDGYTPQGIATIDDQIFITAYKNNENSRIYVYDQLTNRYKGILVLNNKSHVGGISYDSVNKIIFVTGSNGKVNTYDYQKIERVLNSKLVSESNDFKIVFSNDEDGENYFQIKNNININYTDGMNSKAATVYFYDGTVYIGSFEGIGLGILVSYDLSYNKDENIITTSDIKTVPLPTATQGIAVTEYKDAKYLITAQSIGNSRSTITVFKEQNGEYKSGRIYLDDKGIEGIEVNEKGQLIAVFENGRNEILITNLEKIEENYDFYSITDEFMQDIYGFGYEVKNKLKEIIDSIKE